MRDKRRPRLSGFVRERGNSRSLIVRIDGKQYTKTVHTRTRREALAMLPAFIAEVQSGTHEAAREALKARLEAPTFREATNVYLTDYMRQDADGASTRRVYRHAFNALTKDIGDVKLGDVTERMLHRALRKLRQCGRWDGEGLSFASVQLIHAALSVFFARMVKLRLIPASPLPKFSDLSLGREQSSDRVRRSALTRGQVSALLAACDDDAVRVWATVLVATGARPGEALAIRWQDVDLDRGVLHITGSVKPGTMRGQWQVGSTKTPSSVRSLPMGPALVAVLVAERDRQETLLRQLSDIPDGVVPVRPFLLPANHVFPRAIDHRDTPASHDKMRAMFKLAAIRAGMPDVSPHWLRHTMLSHVIAGDANQPGISVVDAARLAGHANAATTSRTYAHAVAANLHRGAVMADALIAPQANATVEPLRNTADV